MSLSNWTSKHFLLAALAAAMAVAPPLGLAGARAAEPVFAAGQPIITGFPGVLLSEDVPDGADPLDYTFIDLDGQALAIQSLATTEVPEGQLIETPEVFGVTAADVGLVFGVALDNAPETSGALAPNIYLAASSAFGLNLVVPDADGNPMRSRTGAPEASFAPGQWGGAGGETGYPGSIWKVDGTSGEVSLFTTIVTGGASLGSLAFDPGTQQFFVSDLDTGMIYRLALDGTIIDTFDHGVDGRPTHELEPIEDDLSVADITDGAFDTAEPSSWGFTQPERRVYGLVAENGRLFYAAGAQVWSVRLNDDGSFGAPRWELDIVAPTASEIASIVFDSKGRMILAQRGATVGSYDYSVLAEAGTSSVLRYSREFPDDPATPGTWVEEPDSYAIGVSAEGMNASGGIALGYGFDTESNAYDGACGTTLWASGDTLRDNPDLEPPLDGPAYVAGLQGVPRSWVRPLNDPAMLSAFTDVDGNTDDDQALLAGHVGAVAMWAPCAGGEAFVAPDEPDVFLPPPDYVPSPDFNLTLEKWASPYDCFDGGANWWCNFTIRIENTGDTPYWGPLTISDELPDGNPGAVMNFWPAPPWSCGPTGPTAYECSRGPVLLFPGDGVTLHEVVQLPKALVDYCHIANVAEIAWPFGFHDDEPADDFDVGVAGIAAPGCVPPAPGTSDLVLTKVGAPWCASAGADWACSYVVQVQNAGPGNYTGPIQVKDTLGVNAPATTLGPWACAQAGPVLTCDIIAAPVNVPPGWSSAFVVTAKIKKTGTPPVCDLDNKANISVPVGGPTNTDGSNDFDSATANIPVLGCLLPQPHPDLQAKKQGLGCGAFFSGWYCEWKITITNVGPNPYIGSLHFKDESIGAVANTLPSVAAYCAGTPTAVDCNPVGPVLYAPGVPHALTFYTLYNGGPEVCSANNTLTIVDPSPGSPLNPAGNDSATVNQAIPNPACAGLPVLNITKTAKGCASDPSSPDWLCKFDIKVKNIGAAAQPGPIEFLDINTKPTTFNTPACVPSGASVWTCTRPAPLNAGSTWTVQATTRVDPNGVTLADCEVLNTVWLFNPFAADPGHLSEASQKVPQLFINVGPGPVYVYCDPPGLKLEKTVVKAVKAGDGYNTTFQIKAISTGPDPYVGTVEVEDLLPDGTSYVSSDWVCVPTTGNDVHCSSPFKNIPVGKYTATTITVHTPADVAKRNDCSITNVVNASISAEVLHSDEGVQYTAEATAQLPGEACGKPPACPTNQTKPDGGCCEAGLLWNGKQCAKPQPKCPDDSHINADGQCVCDKGTEGRPGQCKPIEVTPVCPDDSHLNSAGKCVCDRGTEGKPGRCEPIEVEPVCPDDSHLNNAGECVCDRGTEGRPGRCEPIEVEPVCPDDSHLNSDGQCVCDRGTEGRPGRCEPIEVEPVCPDDSHLDNRGQCVCDRGTEGQPGQCKPIEQEAEPEPVEPKPAQCPDDSAFNRRLQACVCLKGTVGDPGSCVPLLQLNLGPLLQ
ncbi:MAG: hypothetical protein EOP22_15270 [Hyphomicrobiales bacterium]|nr:MAG: hypothetical protein EOP22_15270 [Hyphomicrobiales bacterium]